VYVFKVVDDIALLYGLITFGAVDHGALPLEVGRALSCDAALVGLLR